MLGLPAALTAVENWAENGHRSRPNHALMPDTRSQESIVTRPVARGQRRAAGVDEGHWPHHFQSANGEARK